MLFLFLLLVYLSLSISDDWAYLSLMHFEKRYSIHFKKF